MFKKTAVTTLLFYVYSADAFAADPHHGEAQSGHHGEASSGGLPQLDFTTYPSQIFWMVVFFVLMHIFFSRKSLPDISRTIENRSERINNDLDSAARLKEEAEDVQKAYEDSLVSAREKSTELFTQVEQEIKANAEKAAADFAERSSSEIDQLEKNIDEARQKAMDDMSEVAADVAAEAAEKIIGVRADKKEAKAVVQSIYKAA